MVEKHSSRVDGCGEGARIFVSPPYAEVEPVRASPANLVNAPRIDFHFLENFATRASIKDSPSSAFELGLTRSSWISRRLGRIDRIERDPCP
jgi:hypothetical protein